MNMNRVNEIIKKHNELLDSMTEQERIDYYAEVGLVVECETEIENVSSISAIGVNKEGIRSLEETSRYERRNRHHGNQLSRRAARNPRVKRIPGSKNQKAAIYKFEKAR